MAKAGRPKGGDKSGGRQKGTPNKKTVELLELWEKLKYDPAEALHGLLPELEPDKQADIHMKLMEFKYPKRKAVEMSGPDGEAIETKSAEALEIVQEFKKTMTEYAGERVKK